VCCFESYLAQLIPISVVSGTHADPCDGIAAAGLDYNMANNYGVFSVASKSLRSSMHRHGLRQIARKIYDK
jgi:hypothetical protein